MDSSIAIKPKQLGAFSSSVTFISLVGNGMCRQLFMMRNIIMFPVFTCFLYWLN